MKNVGDWVLVMLGGVTLLAVGFSDNGLAGRVRAVVEARRAEATQRDLVEQHWDAISANADVPVVMFTDYQCPFCKRLHATLEEKGLSAELGYRQLPLPNHVYATAAASFAICARGAGKFGEAQTLLYGTEWGRGAPDWSAMSAQLDLDPQAVQRCMTSEPTVDEIAADLRLAELLAINSTPTLVTPNGFVRPEDVSGFIADLALR